MIATDRFERREWLIVGVLTLIGAVLRIRGFGHLGLTHFDEGIYAFSGLWSVTPNGFDPQVISYAPPGFPILVGLSYVIFGVADFSAILVAIVCGVFTIPTAAWVGRRTFGPGAGAAAAAFAALSLAHIAFSRKALTDAPFLLCWLLAFGIGGWFLEKPGAWRAVLLGLSVGIAENFKYNGWIAGVIVALAGIFGLFAAGSNRPRRSVAETFGFGLLAALVSALCYYPWYAYVERHGGYSALIQHQRGYLGPNGTWLSYLRQQLAQVIALSGGVGWGMLTWTVAWFASALVVMRKGEGAAPSRLSPFRLFLGCLIGVVAITTVPDLGWWVGLAWAVRLALDARSTYRMLASFWLILSVMTPFYHPYARLWLPLHATGWLLLAGAVVRFGPFLETLPTHWENRKRLPRQFIAQLVVMLICITVAKTHWGPVGPRILSPMRIFARTDNLREVAARIANMPTPKKNRGIKFRVLARRPLYFYFALIGANPVQLLASATSLTSGPGSTGDWAVLDSVQLSGSPEDESAWRSIVSQWRLRQSIEVELDPIVLLDVFPQAVSPGFEIHRAWISVLGDSPAGDDDPSTQRVF